MNKKQITHWLSVIVIGIALGLALQFVRAWTEPTTSPPNGNVGAPINTGAIEQIKTGDICTTAPNGTGAKKCLSTSGTPSAVCDNDTVCDIDIGENTANCPSDCPSSVNPPVTAPCQCNYSEIYDMNWWWVGATTLACDNVATVLLSACSGYCVDTYRYNCNPPGSWVLLQIIPGTWPPQG